MNKQSHHTRTTWPLYLAIAVAASASIATSEPYWSRDVWLAGPDLALAPDLPEQLVSLTIRFSPGQDHADILVGGEIEYEGADEQLRIALVEPGKRALATHVQRAEGDGRLAFTLEVRDAALSCAPAGDGTCVQELAVRFNTDGVRTGVHAIRWGVTLHVYGDENEPPADLVFDAELAGGRKAESFPYRFDFVYPSAEVEQGRWRLMDTDSGWYYFEPGQTKVSRHIVVRGAGSFASSELLVPFKVDFGDASPDSETGFRVAVIPDDPAAGPGVEHRATVTGAGAYITTLRFPEPLDCAGTGVCERGFDIVLEAEIDRYGSLDVRPHAVLDGDGLASGSAFIEIVPDEVAEAASGQD